MYNSETINVKITNNEQLFSHYSYDDDKLNADLSDYLIEQAKTQTTNDQIVIKIHTDDNSFARSEAAQCIHHHFHVAYTDSKRELNYLTRTAIIMLLVGLSMLTVLYLCNTFFYNFYLFEVLEVIVWVFIWEAVDVFFLRRHAVKKESRVFRRLAYAEIKIVTGSQPR